MKFTFLGTAAANAFPEAFCRCDNCEAARQRGGPSLRKRTAALINDDLLLDLGPDIMAASQQHAIPLTNVAYCLQTHPHADHLDLSHLLSRSPGYGTVGAPTLHIYGSAETLVRASETFIREVHGAPLLDPATQAELNYKTHVVEPLRMVTVGPYQIYAVPANHAPGMGALLYAISDGTHTIFYGTDTATFAAETWAALRESELTFDLVLLDHTYGPEQFGSDHLSAREVIAHAERMREMGLLKSDGRVFATHIAHEGNPDHPTLVAYAQEHGYEVGYDGLVLTL